jgi:predicted lipid-binding transport protein (Tim44 family)
MSQAFDPFNIILIVAAVVIVFKLRSVLGIRTGHERNYDPFSPSQTAETETREDNVIPLPGHEGELAKGEDAEEVEPIWAGYADEGSDLANGLQEIANTDSSFAPGEFLEGAKMAYEMIVTAFAESDKKSLKSLLTTDVYKGFAKAIDQRATDGETLDYKFVGIDKASLVSGAMVRRKANVTVKFVSQMISATRDVTGAVIDGDPTQIGEVTEIWTFERDTSSKDPNWKLSVTEVTG